MIFFYHAWEQQMSDKLYYLASTLFEAACQIEHFAPSNPSSRLHGHSYHTSMRVSSEQLEPDVKEAPLEALKQQLNQIIRPLDYSSLNDHISQPTDENIARWIHKHAQWQHIDRVAIKSTQDSGVDLDSQGAAHIWRRYRFEAAHQLPNVSDDHQCGRMHGHGFEVILHANQDKIADHGIEFETLDKYWQSIHQQLDYSCLNDISGLENPTSEVLAHWIWQQLKDKIEPLSWVTVYETHSSGCHYNGSHYRIWKEQRFESAVKLKYVAENDKRRQLHGHSYLIRLHLTAELDEVMGWTVDYGDVKQLFKPIYQQLDHHQLHLLEGIDDADVASILYWIKNKMADALPQLDRIDLFETPGCGAMLCWGEEGPALPD